MKQYVIDELRPLDYTIIKSYLDEKLGNSGLEGLYKLPIDSKLLTDVQLHHTQCQPYYFAIELTPNQMACELFIRTDQKIRCGCMDYATEVQRNWLIQLTEMMLDQLKIAV